jgi:mono/diheme cytochrome c family protein
MEMKRWVGQLIVGALVAIVVLAGAGLFLLRGGISARPEPSAIEAAVARSARHLAIPASVRALEIPVPESPRLLAAGLAHFADHCAVCHGNDGRGKTPFGEGLYPRPPDLTARATQDLSDGELFYIIENGVRFTGMPAFGVEGQSEASWHLVRFIRHLPALTAEEVHEMERVNPRSPSEWRELQEEDDFLGGDSGSK